MPRRKTVKFTYEGSSKPIKFVYLIGLSILTIGGWLFFIGTCFSVFYFFEQFSKQNLNEELFINIIIIMGIHFIIGWIGQMFIGFAQFLNWWDRGSVNSKIFRKPK